MRTVFLLLIVTGLAMLNLSMVHTNHVTLTAYDFDIEEITNRHGPSIGSLEKEGLFDRSYNEWMCFPVHESVTLTCTEHVMVKVVKTPMIAVYAAGEALEIETPPITDINCEETVKVWTELLEGQSNFCVLAAYLQNLPHENYGDTKNRSLWILDAFKTGNGYWMVPELLEKLESNHF